MEKKELTCIGCPVGCSITVKMEGEEIVSVEGNSCRIGDRYARSEVTWMFDYCEDGRRGDCQRRGQLLQNRRPLCALRGDESCQNADKHGAHHRRCHTESVRPDDPGSAERENRGLHAGNRQT